MCSVCKNIFFFLVFLLVFSFKFCFAIAFNICAIYSDCVFIATAYWCCRHRRNVTPEVLRGEYKISGPYELKHTCIIHVKRTPKSYGKWTFFQSKVTCDFTFLQVIAILKLSIENWRKKKRPPTMSVSQHKC